MRIVKVRALKHPRSLDAAHIRILQTTDVHLNLSSYDYFTDRPDVTTGLLSLSSVIEQARKEAPCALLFDTGDFLQGTPLGDLFALTNPNGDALHPAISVMNAMGYDAGVIGNHEFNFGLDFLKRVISWSSFPVVLANAATQLGDDPLQDVPLFQPYTILDRQVIDQNGDPQTLRIGVIGFVPPQVSTWERRHLHNRLYTREIVETAKAYIPKIRAEGADIVIALSHSGIARQGASGASENASLQLAAVEGIDVVLCGHQHNRFPSPDFDEIAEVDSERGTLHGKPAVMAGHWGRELGIVDLFLKHDRQTGWQVTDHASSLRAARPETAADTRLSRLLDANHKATLTYIRTPVAETRRPMHTYFTYLGFDLATRAVALATRDRAAQLLGPTKVPLLAAASPFRAGGHAGPQYFTEVEAGALTIRNLSDLYPFPNTLSVMRVTGAELRDWLERSAGKFAQITEGKQDQPALVRGFPSYNFDMILGVDYQIDLTQPPKYTINGQVQHPRTQRISSLTHGGHPVRDNQEFLVASNSYRAGGAGLVTGQCIGTEVMSTQEEVHTVLMNYFQRVRVADMPNVLNWEFAPVPDTSILMPVSPRARRYLPDLPLELTRTGQVVDGYELYRHAL